MASLSSEQRKFLERSAMGYLEHLDEAAAYLEGRGIDLGHARSNALGVVRNPLPGHEHLEGRLAIPYLTDFGPVNMTFRCIKDHVCKENACHKYELQRGLPTNLYGVQSIAGAEEWIVVTEGELDCLIMKQIGIPAVGISGVEKWQDHWPNVLEDFSRVYLFEDGDDAGEKLWQKMSYELSNMIRVKMPKGEDVNSTYLSHGADYLRGRIKK